jgi:hypothetical protein
MQWKAFSRYRLTLCGQEYLEPDYEQGNHTGRRRHHAALKLFSGSTFPREQITPAIGVGFSAYGTPNTDGTSYEPKHIWNFVAIVSPADAELLDVLETIGRTENILIYDYTRRVWDTAARSRALAPGASEVTKAAKPDITRSFMAESPNRSNLKKTALTSFVRCN